MAIVGEIQCITFGDRREPVAQGIIEDQVAGGAKRQHARGLTRAVTPSGQIPIGIGQALDVGSAGYVGQPKTQVARCVGNFHSRRDDEDARESWPRGQQAGYDVGLARVQVSRVVCIDSIAQGAVHHAARRLINTKGLGQDGGTTIDGAADCRDANIVPHARGTQVQGAFKLSVESAGTGSGVGSGNIFTHREIDAGT